MLTASSQAADPLDVVIRNAAIYDGSGHAPYPGDVAIRGDAIVALGTLDADAVASARFTLDAGGLAVAPGFINMLSWATETLLVDGRSQSDIRQGVTLEVMGEGNSMGPLNETMKRELATQQGDLKYDVTWTTLGEYLDHLVARGVSCNVASFVGATSVRIHELGYANRVPTTAELLRMQALVQQAMEEGAVGLSSALIYAPAFYARTVELTALARVAARYGGLYISHIRSEGSRLIQSLDEFLATARAANVRAEVYHFKAAGRSNWGKMDAAIARIEAAREAGLEITADMYCYPAAATGLDASMPPWVQEGGFDAWAERLRQPAIRQRLKREMTAPATTWENFFHAAGSPTNIVLVGFKSEALKPLTGLTLAEVARQRGQSPAETAMDLVIKDGSRVETVYFLMSEENLRKLVRLPWISFGSDAGSLAPEGVFLKSAVHPRAYGNFARLLGKYVRDERLVPLEEAIRRLTTLPATNLRLDRRGALRPGYFADVVIFDPATIQDHATFAQPHQFATGVKHVFVNGVQVLKDGEHTGAKPGRVVRGPGYKPR